MKRTYCGKGGGTEECQREDKGEGSDTRHDEKRPEGLVGSRLVPMIQVPRL